VVVWGCRIGLSDFRGSNARWQKQSAFTACWVDWGTSHKSCHRGGRTGCVAALICETMRGTRNRGGCVTSCCVWRCRKWSDRWFRVKKLRFLRDASQLIANAAFNRCPAFLALCATRRYTSPMPGASRYRRHIARAPRNASAVSIECGPAQRSPLVLGPGAGTELGPHDRHGLKSSIGPSWGSERGVGLTDDEVCDLLGLNRVGDIDLHSAARAGQ
jgi:hypothetical protein